MAAKAPARKKTTRAAKKRLITPEDINCFHLATDAQVSPDGSRVLFNKSHIGDKNEKLANLYMVDVDGGKPRPFTNGGKDGHGRWAPDGSRIAFISGRQKRKPQIYLISAEGGEAAPLTKLPEGSIAGFSWSPDGTMLAVLFREQDSDWTEEAEKERKEKGLNTPPRVLDDVVYRLDGDGYFNAQRHQLYIVDVATGEHRFLYKDTLGWMGYDWSPDSKRIAVTTNTDRRAIMNYWKAGISIIDVKTRKVTKVPNLPEGVKEAVRWSPDGKLIAYTGQDSRKSVWGCHNTHLFVADPKKGLVRKLTERDDHCLAVATLGDTAEASFGADIRWAPDSKKIYARIGWHGDGHLASISVSRGGVTFLSSGEGNWSFGELSADGKRVAVSHQTHTKLAEIHIADITATDARLTKLTDFNGPFLTQVHVAKPTSHWVTAEDGHKVQCWVMRPPNLKANRRYPAVLEIHGGPHTQYGSAFFHEFQTLAAAGYVVFFSNPRGSKGYGEDHCAAIKGDWGNKDWLDVQAVTEFMRSQPFVNPKKMGIMGGSYGGYMTNWAIGHTNEFAGAITDRCVSNMVSMAGSSDFPLVPGEYWEGNAWSKPEKLWQQSPIAYFGNVKTPTLIIHSEGDLRCNVEQGEQVFAALQVRRVPSRFVRYPASTSHGMSRGGPTDLRIHRLHQILDWWKTYLK
jgi:dipeptidyl aminopeptidase/acylaminoacyl peptidase